MERYPKTLIRRTHCMSRRTILACQNGDMITKTRILCLKIQETYQMKPYKAIKIMFNEHLSYW